MNRSQKKEINDLLAEDSMEKLAEQDNELAILHKYAEISADNLEELLQESSNDVQLVGDEFGQVHQTELENLEVSNSQQMFLPGGQGTGEPLIESSLYPDALVQSYLKDARCELEYRDIDTTQLTLDQFFSREELQQLDERIQSEIDLYPNREPWQRWNDYIVVCFAGILAGLWELGVKKLNILELGVDGKNLPQFRKKREKYFKDKGTEYLERYWGKQTDSGIAVLDVNGRAMKNPMTRHVMDARIPKELLEGHKPDLHRGVGPMHDLCRIRQTVEMMMSEDPDFKVLDKSAKMLSGGKLRMMGVKGADASQFNVFAEPGAALVAVIFHLFSDFVTARSLPLPGTSWLSDLGSEHWHSSIINLYEQGVNCRNVFGGATQLSSPVITEMILRLYFVLTFQKEPNLLQNFLQRGLRLQTRREREMLIVAHSISAAIGSFRFVLSQQLWNLNGAAVLAMIRHGIALLNQVQKARGECLEKILSRTAQLTSEIDDQFVCGRSPIEWLSIEEIDQALGLTGYKEGSSG